MMKLFHAILGLVISALVFPTSNAQEIGTELCSCAPNTYNFTLDFSLFCPPVNITLGDAVQATSCLVSPFGDPTVDDLIPVAVQSIDVLELGQDLRVLVQENIEGNFVDGDTFSYSSIAALPGGIASAVDIPRALQLNLVGVNANDEPIINVYIITFTNSCGTYPVLQEGQSAGWTRFNDLGPPNREFCPLAPESTPSPTDAGTVITTTAPTATPSAEVNITDFPSDSPSMTPTVVNITDVPSDSPSMAPTDGGSAMPSDIPSFSPTAFPSGTPSPTVAPVIMSMSMEMSMDLMSLSMIMTTRDYLPDYDSEVKLAELMEMEFGVPKRATDARKSAVVRAAKGSKAEKSSKSERRRLGRRSTQ